MQTFRGRVSDDFGPQTLDAFVEAMLLAWPHQKTWAIYGDGELGGVITFQRVNHWLGTAHCVFKPDFQGKNIAPEACKVAIAEMFGEGIGKLAFYVVGRNLAIGSMLIQLGAKNEGSLRGHTLCGGKPTAINVYGLLKEEFENVYRSGTGIDHIEHHRGRPGDCGGSDQRGIEDEHQLDDSHALAGNESAPGPDLSV